MLIIHGFQELLPKVPHFRPWAFKLQASQSRDCLQFKGDRYRLERRILIGVQADVVVENKCGADSIVYIPTSNQGMPRQHFFVNTPAINFLSILHAASAEYLLSQSFQQGNCPQNCLNRLSQCHILLVHLGVLSRTSRTR